nr:hypothetical protein [Tanacetum cinerariifolium]
MKKKCVGNKMHKAFPLPVMEFPLLGEVPTASEECSHCQKKRKATAVKIALLLKSRRNCHSKSDDNYTKVFVVTQRFSFCYSLRLLCVAITLYKKWINKTPLSPKYQSWTQENLSNGSLEYNNIFNMSIMPCGRTVTLTAEDMQKRKNDVKARTTLLLSLLDEHQLRLSKYKTVQELWAAILKTFGGNEATKKTKKNLLKQQYSNFKAEGSETLEQTFNRLQVIIGQLQSVDIEIKHDDLNQKFLTSLALEWPMHTLVWRNRSDLDTMSLDDFYNHLKVYESEVQKKSEPNPQNMAFISSTKHSRGNKDVNTASVSTASTNVPTTSANIGIDEDDIEEMDIIWNMALLSMRADKFWKKTGKKISIQGSNVSYMANDEENHALVADKEAPIEFSLMANTSAESKVFDNSLCSKDYKKNTDCLNRYSVVPPPPAQIYSSPKKDLSWTGLGYSVVPPPPAQIYSSPKKDLSWTGLPEFKDDIVTNYSRPAPTIESSPDDAQNRNSSEEASPSTISPKSFIKFVKANDSPTKSKIYRKPTKKPNKKSENGTSRSQNNTHKSSTPRPDVHKPYRPPMRPMRSNMKGAWPNRTSFNKSAQSYTNRPFQRTSAVRSKYRAPWVPTVNRKFSTVSRNFSTVNRKFPTANRKFPTGGTKFHTTDLGKNGKAVKPSACWFWKPSQNLSNKADAPASSGNLNPTASTTNPLADQMETLTVETSIPTVSSPISTACFTDSQEPLSDTRLISKRVANQVETPSLDNILTLTNRFEDIPRVTTNSVDSDGVEADVSNMETTITACPTPTLKIHKDHPKIQIIGHVGVRPIGTKWVLKNKKDKRGIVIRNKARLVAQGHIQDEGIDYDEVFALVARIEAIRLFLAYASFIGFTIYQMDVKNTFLYDTFDEEVYVMQPPGSQDPEFPARVYKVEKAMYGLHQAPRASYAENLKPLCIKKFQLSAMGELNFFLGLQVLQKKDGIFLSQDKTPQKNGVAERRNRTLIEAARTMLADAKLPVTFWAEAVNTSCYVQNRVLVNKSQNKTPYELFNGRTPAIGFLKPFGCHVMILNTLDNLGKFEAKEDEGYFIGYSMSSKVFRVFNKRTRRVEENLHVEFLENKVIKKDAGPNWLFDIDSLTKSMNYVPVDAGKNSTNLSGTKDAASQKVKKDVYSLRYIALPNWVHDALLESSSSKPQEDCSTDVPERSGNCNPTATLTNPSETLTVETPIPTVSSPVPTACLNDSPEPSSDTRLISKKVANQEETPSLDNILTLTNRFEDILGVTTNSVDSDGVEADVSNMETSITASPTPTLRILKDHPKSQIISHVDTPIQTKNKAKEISDALQEPSWVEAMQEEILQFKIQNVWILVDYPKGVRPIGTKWVLKNKKDERGIVIRNKAMLVAQGHTQEEGINYDEVFAPVARIEAIRLFLAYASFMGFIVYQMDVKSAFLYGDILKKFRSSDVRSLNTLMDKENPWRKDRTRKDVDLHLYRSMIGSLMYLTASRPDIMFAVWSSQTRTWYPKESPFDLVAYLDSDYGGATQDRKSTTGGCQFLGRRLISWQSKKQTIVATSTTKAEYVTAASCCGFRISYLIMEIRHYFIRDCFEKKLISVDHIHTDENVADLLTKSFDAGRFHYLVCKLFPLLGKLSTVSVFLGFGLTFAGTFTYYVVLRILMISPRLIPLSEHNVDFHLIVDFVEASPLRIAQSSALSPVADEPASSLIDVSEEMVAKFKAREMEINRLKARVKLLEDREEVAAERSGDDASIKGRNLDEGEAVAERVSDETEEMATVLTSMETTTVLASGAAEVPTGSGSIPTAGSPAAEVPTASPIFATATLVTPYTRKKGKETMVESETLKKKKIQEQMDIQMARQLEEEMERDAQRMNEQIAKDAKIARIHAEEELQIMIDGLDKKLISDLAKYQDNYAKIYKFQTQQRNPWSKKQKRDYYMAIIKSNLGWKVKDFRGMTFEEIEEKFTTVWKQVKDFIPMGSKEEAEKFKRKGIRFEQESVKKVKTSEEVPKEVKTPDEVREEKIKEIMQLVPIEEAYVEALQVKHPIIDWKVHTEGQRSYWKIIRLGGSSTSYQFFLDLLKHTDKEDLNQLWDLVKESLNNRQPTSDKEMELWVELQRLYEPDDEDQLWTHTQNLMHAPVEWKLYDMCGVHQVTSKDKEIFMLVEKDYPLRKGMVIVMICYKLQVENYSQMANDLSLKIYKFANCPSQQDPVLRNINHKISKNRIEVDKAKVDVIAKLPHLTTVK